MTEQQKAKRVPPTFEEVKRKLVKALFLSEPRPISPKVQRAELLEAAAKSLKAEARELRREDAAQSGKRIGRPARTVDDATLIKVFDHFIANAQYKSDAKIAAMFAKKWAKTGIGVTPKQILKKQKTLKNWISSARTGKKKRSPQKKASR